MNDHRVTGRRMRLGVMLDRESTTTLLGRLPVDRREALPLHRETRPRDRYGVDLWTKLALTAAITPKDGELVRTLGANTEEDVWRIALACDHELPRICMVDAFTSDGTIRIRLVKIGAVWQYGTVRDPERGAAEVA